MANFTVPPYPNSLPWGTPYDPSIPWGTTYEQDASNSTPGNVNDALILRYQFPQWESRENPMEHGDIVFVNRRRTRSVGIHLQNEIVPALGLRDLNCMLSTKAIEFKRALANEGLIKAHSEKVLPVTEKEVEYLMSGKQYEQPKLSDSIKNMVGSQASFADKMETKERFIEFFNKKDENKEHLFNNTLYGITQTWNFLGIFDGSSDSATTRTDIPRVPKRGVETIAAAILVYGKCRFVTNVWGPRIAANQDMAYKICRNMNGAYVFMPYLGEDLMASHSYENGFYTGMGGEKIPIWKRKIGRSHYAVTRSKNISIDSSIEYNTYHKVSGVDPHLGSFSLKDLKRDVYTVEMFIKQI